MIAVVGAAGVVGVQAFPVRVEVDVGPGLPGFAMVGLPDGAVRESRERVSSALRAVGYQAGGRRTTVNLAPADLRKEGSSYDLAVAVGWLVASGQEVIDGVAGWILAGELGLDGTLNPVRGALPVALLARSRSMRVLLPRGNADEAIYAEGAAVHVAATLTEALDVLKGNGCVGRLPCGFPEESAHSASARNGFASVRGHALAKRALEVAAAGGHNFLLAGPPGSGKSMLARSLPEILPPLSEQEALECLSIRSCAGLAVAGTAPGRERPFRSPHHALSVAAMVGGGSLPRPGEVTLAHNGLLFLDELPEFSRTVLESLRAPLEDGLVLVSRARASIRFPARFMLGCAMNPCPCGFLLDPHKPCVCGESRIRAYLGRISGPLLDRIDIQVEMDVPDWEVLNRVPVKVEPSGMVRERVAEARERQWRRFASRNGCNAAIDSEDLERYCRLTGVASDLLLAAGRKMGVSGRGRARILKVARTIADLHGAVDIGETDVAEALQYRVFADPGSWLRRASGTNPEKF